MLILGLGHGLQDWKSGVEDLDLNDFKEMSWSCKFYGINSLLFWFVSFPYIEEAQSVILGDQ